METLLSSQPRPSPVAEWTRNGLLIGAQPIRSSWLSEVRLKWEWDQVQSSLLDRDPKEMGLEAEEE